ncbi:MAG: hypothetical protein BA870_04765 [Desulfuromonadales bacterium C00003094]|jgi:diguanylate cyclase (GGDEF)-like protein/PAS domain S-box-containing protein|nr:MAG: hypothetical protein BA870_04765 [Desulfuromonadales bacterium C00003094]
MLVNAEGHIVAGSGQTLPRLGACHELLSLHHSCPSEACYIRLAFQTSQPVTSNMEHAELGPIQVKVMPLSGADGRSELAILQISHSPLNQTSPPAAQAFDSLPQTVFEADLLGRLTFANRHSLDKFEYTAEDLAEGINIMQVIAPDDRERVLQLFFRVLQGAQGLSAEFTALTKSGGRFFVLAYAMPRTENGRIVGARGMLMDISEQKAVEHSLRESEQRYQHLAHHNQLTNLPNRTLLMERLQQLLGRADQHRKPLAVMVLDVDRFKQINNSLGNDCGNQTLCEITRRLQQLLRQSDTLACLGGNEFVLLYSDVPKPDSLSLLVQRLLDAFQEPMQIAEHIISLTASIGIATSLRGPQDGETLLRQAIIGMNEAKTQGGNCYAYFSQEMQNRCEETFLYEKHMREALQRQEFYLHYQPQIDLTSGKMSGVEALVRWAGPCGTNPSPEVFIKVAEDSGLIHPLGDFVLYEACAQNLRWQKSGLPPIKVTVNISAKQFGQPNFVNKVLQTLADTGLASHWLELEITESAIMANVKEAIGTMQRLQAAGVGFAIDDFGTGYSSLNYLRQLPLSKLKIDRSFLLDIPGNKDNEKLVFSILTLARSFDLQTVAEGIETQDQLEYLKQLECDLGQGYLFSRPVSPEAIHALLSDAHC